MKSNPKSAGRDPAEITDTIAGYDRIAGDFSARWGHLRLEHALDAFTSRLFTQASGRRRVLDLGCGPGRDLDFLGRLGCCVAGLDRSNGMLAQARLRLPGVPLVLADVRFSPFVAGSFDGIWACASLLHLRRSEFPAALAEARRLLCCPGGVLYLALKGGTGQRWVMAENDRRVFFCYYQPREIKTALNRAGFQIVEDWIEADSAGRSQPWINVIADVRPA